MFLYGNPQQRYAGLYKQVKRQEAYIHLEHVLIYHLLSVLLLLEECMDTADIV